MVVDTRREFLSRGLVASLAAYSGGLVKPAPTVAAPIQSGNQGSEQDWLTWYQKTESQDVEPSHIEQPESDDAMSSDDLRALAVQRGKKIAPGTMAQHDQYIGEYDKRPIGKIVRLCRQKAIFGIWATGGKKGPVDAFTKTANLSVDKVRWLAGQSQTTKYLKWLNKVDPACVAAFVRANPQYRTQYPQV